MDAIKTLLNSEPIYRAKRAFLTAFSSAMVVFLMGLSAAPELHLQKAAVTAALVGAISAGLRAVLDGVVIPGLQKYSSGGSQAQTVTLIEIRNGDEAIKELTDVELELEED